MLFLLMAGCAKDERPEGILPPADMKEILKSIHLANALAERKAVGLEERKAEREALYQSILTYHQTTRDTFYTSYLYYLDHPEELDQIYKTIIRELDEQERIEQDLRYSRDTDKKGNLQLADPPKQEELN